MTTLRETLAGLRADEQRLREAVAERDATIRRLRDALRTARRVEAALRDALGVHGHADEVPKPADRQPGGSTGPSCGCAPGDPPCQRTPDGRGGHLWHGGTTKGGNA